MSCINRCERNDKICKIITMKGVGPTNVNEIDIVTL